MLDLIAGVCIVVILVLGGMCLGARLREQEEAHLREVDEIFAELERRLAWRDGKCSVCGQSKGLDAEKEAGDGTMWITDGCVNKKISKEEAVPEGWFKGRKLK